jgi:hypothetical protein
MHDLDRTLNEFESEFGTDGEYEFDGEQEGEGEGEWLGEMDGEMDESEVTAMAAELLGVQDEEELEQFFGKLIKRAAGAARSFARSSAGRALGGILKTAAGKALPVVGGAIGGYFGGPGGAKFGSQAGRFVKGRLGWELEGGDQEEELEIARGLVKTAIAATRQAAHSPAAAQSAAAVKRATLQAAQQHAPQLVRVLAGARPSSGGARGQSGGQGGRWVRRGRMIVLLGV